MRRTGISEPPVSNAHSATMTAIIIAPAKAKEGGYETRPDRAQRAKPRNAPATIPVSLMHTGSWDPFRTKLLASS